MFSIIMPAYNAEEFIEESINSIIRQNYKNYELIVIDDGSNDSTPYILQKIIKCNQEIDIRVIRQPNSGVANARNKGAFYAKYDFLAFLDSDDLWRENKLLIYENIIKKKLLNNLFIYSNYISFDKYSTQHIKCKKVILPKEIFIQNPICTSTVVMSRQIFADNNGFNSNLNGTEDWDLWIRASENSDLIMIEDELTYYRRLPNSLSRNIVKHYKEKLKVFELNKLNFNTKEQKECLNMIFYEHLSNLKKNSKYISIIYFIIFDVFIKYSNFAFFFTIFKLKYNNHD